MISTREQERSLRLNSGILMNTLSRGELESCRRYFTRRHGNYAGVELFDLVSEGRANKRSRKAVIRLQPLGGPL